MHGHWLPDWIETRPWWVKWSFGLGLGVVLAFLPGLLNPNWQQVGVAVGTILMAISLIGGAWQGFNGWREKSGKPRLKLEPSHLIILGLLIALGGVIWQMRATPANTSAGTAERSASVTSRSAPPQPYYSAAQKDELANRISTIYQLLNKDVLDLSQRWAKIAVPPVGLANMNKQQVEELISQINTAKSETLDLNKKLWINTVNDNVDLAQELRALIGGDNAKISQLVSAEEPYSEGVFLLWKMYDGLNDQQLKTKYGLMLFRYGSSLQQAAFDLKKWVEQSNVRIATRRKSL